VRVLIVPGLHGSGPAHWQTWLQAHWRHALRVRQDDEATPDLARWSRRIGEAIDRDPDTPWVAVAHSFGCLALAHHLGQRAPRDVPGGGIAAALLVAPADPERFGVASALPSQGLGMPGALIASDTDPWMAAANAQRWASVWDLRFVNLGDVGHINVASGFGPLPRALQLTQALIGRVERSRRPQRAGIVEFQFAV
jgi:hypothetical protein